MNAFETMAIVEDSSHLTLRTPVPFPVAQECRVIVLVEARESQNGSGWPERFFDEIRIADPAFLRPAQGELPPVPALDAQNSARY
jgi:hypothetical protein